MTKTKGPLLITYLALDVTSEYLKICASFEVQAFSEKVVKSVTKFNRCKPDEFRNIIFEVPAEIEQEFEEWFNSL